MDLSELLSSAEQFKKRGTELFKVIFCHLTYWISWNRSLFTVAVYSLGRQICVCWLVPTAHVCPRSPFSGWVLYKTT